MTRLPAGRQGLGTDDTDTGGLRYHLKHFFRDPRRVRDENRFEGFNDISMNSSDLDTDKGHLRNIIL